MRVGVYLHEPPADVGGGYTFEGDVLAALETIHAESRHHFVLLRAGAASTAAARSPLPVERLTIAATERLRGALRRRFSFARARPGARSPIDVAAERQALDFVWFAGAGAQWTELPYLTVVWDLEYRRTPWFPELSSAGEWERREMNHEWFLPRASAIVTGTEVGRAEIERTFRIPHERIVVLPHPTPRFALAATGSPRSALPAIVRDRRYVLYPAQFWSHKNHVNLVLGFAQAVKRGGPAADLQLVLTGSDKGNRAHVERVMRSVDMEGRVHFPGFVDRPTLAALYRNAEALVYASWCGPENLPPLEAFALGCPVVAADVPGAREQLGDAAVLVAPGDPADFAAAIEAVASDAALRERLTANGRARAARWTAEDYVRGVFGVLDRFEPVLRCWARR